MADDTTAGAGGGGGPDGTEFDEARFDAVQDSRWREFRLRLADDLAELTPGARFGICDLWNGALRPCALLGVEVDADDRLTLSVQISCLSPDEPERDGRLALLCEHDWERADGGRVQRVFHLRHVDAAALAAEFALRQVWDIPDPAYLLGDEELLARMFSEIGERSGEEPASS